MHLVYLLRLLRLPLMIPLDRKMRFIGRRTLGRMKIRRDLLILLLSSLPLVRVRLHFPLHKIGIKKEIVFRKLRFTLLGG